MFLSIAQKEEGTGCTVVIYDRREAHEYYKSEVQKFTEMKPMNVLHISISGTFYLSPLLCFVHAAFHKYGVYAV